MKLRNLRYYSPDSWQKIFRYFSYPHFKDLIEKKKLYFCNARQWKDQNEGIVHKIQAEIILRDIGIGNKTDDKYAKGYEYVFNNTYGICWTLEKECEKHWEEYTPGKNGVKVETYVGQLVSTLTKENDYLDSECGTYWTLGRVEYKDFVGINDQKIEKWSDKELLDAIKLRNSSHVLSNFLVKSDCYGFEKEVRVLILPSTEDGSNNDFNHILMKCDCSIINSIVTDPRADKKFRSEVESLCKSVGLEQKVKGELSFS